jgi:hypothetical protein
MLKAAFITLRVLTGVASLATFAGTMVVIFLTGAIRLLKGGAHAAISVTKLFASGFQKSDPAQPVPHLLSLPLIGLAILFLSMFASVFTPGPEDLPPHRCRNGSRCWSLAHLDDGPPVRQPALLSPRHRPLVDLLRSLPALPLSTAPLGDRQTTPKNLTETTCKNRGLSPLDARTSIELRPQV